MNFIYKLENLFQENVSKVPVHGAWNSGFDPEVDVRLIIIFVL
jgi:hypothetical protein